MTSWHERSKKVIPSGSQTYSKSADYYPVPFFATMALGSKIVTDLPTVHMNKEFDDYIMGLGSVILGYKHKRWLEDLDIPHGFNFSAPHPLEVIVAEKLLSYFPHHDMIKFFKNGSDATEIAVRLARAYTNKKVVLYGSYHGFHDWYIATDILSKGIVGKEYYLNVECAVEGNLDNTLHDTACIIIEPSHPKVKEISKLAKDNNIILIFDEVLTGFRHGISGLQKVIGIEPDITCLGKCMANGLPLSAVMGKRDIMMQMEHGVFASSTMGGETVSLAACLQTIKELEEAEKDEYLLKIGRQWFFHARTQMKMDRLEDIISLHGYYQRCGFTFKDDKWKSLYINELFKRGILTNGINNFCLAHTEKDIDNYLYALEEVFKVMKKAKEEGIDKYCEWTIKPAFKR